MKKIILSLLLTLMCFVFAGCKPDSEIEGLGRFEGLSSETELRILNDYNDYRYNSQESVDYRWICFYYGTYNEYIVVGMSVSWPPDVATETKIGEIIFLERVQTILAWENGEFYWFGDAYNNGFLTQSDLKKINALDREFNVYEYELYEEIKNGG